MTELMQLRHIANSKLLIIIVQSKLICKYFNDEYDEVLPCTYTDDDNGAAIHVHEVSSPVGLRQKSCIRSTKAARLPRNF